MTIKEELNKRLRVFFPFKDKDGNYEAWRIEEHYSGDYKKPIDLLKDHTKCRMYETIVKIMSKRLSTDQFKIITTIKPDKWNDEVTGVFDVVWIEDNKIEVERINWVSC